jgi:hypothetical protein
MAGAKVFSMPQIIAQAPEKITKSKTSRTAPFLKIALRI